MNSTAARVFRLGYARAGGWDSTTNSKFPRHLSKCLLAKSFATNKPIDQQKAEQESASQASSKSSSSPSHPSSDTHNHPESSNSAGSSMPPGWEDDPDYNISAFSQLPHRHFGFNQHMLINAEFKEALRQVLWQFRAPIRYAFAYGSGVFPQDSSSSNSTQKTSPHPHAPEAVTKWQTSGGKIIDFIFGVSYTQHWHSLNIQQHRDHYSFLGSMGSGVVSKVQDNFGAGAYFNPYIMVNGMLIKYGVVNLDTIYRDLSEWDTLYIAGRLQKPVKILRDDPRMRLANQVNLISALRTALLMLPPTFTERELYAKIAGISYMGDLRMTFKSESPRKVVNIVDSQMANFRQLYTPLIENLPNITFNDPECQREDWMSNSEANCRLEQDMDPVRRGNMVRRLPKAFRKKLYNHYRGVFDMSSKDFEGLLIASQDEDAFSKRTGGDYDQKIATGHDLDKAVADAIRKTVTWPTYTQTIKGLATAGVGRGFRYLLEKRAKGKEIKQSQLKSQAKKPETDKQVKGRSDSQFKGDDSPSP